MRAERMREARAVHSRSARAAECGAAECCAGEEQERREIVMGALRPIRGDSANTIELRA